MNTTPRTDAAGNGYYVDIDLARQLETELDMALKRIDHLADLLTDQAAQLQAKDEKLRAEVLSLERGLRWSQEMGEKHHAADRHSTAQLQAKERELVDARAEFRHATDLLATEQEKTIARDATIAGLRDEVARLSKAISDCLDWSNGREYEWGDRAINAFEFLRVAQVPPPKPDAVQARNTEK